jgi:hypothetical protein
MGTNKQNGHQTPYKIKIKDPKHWTTWDKQIKSSQMFTLDYFKDFSYLHTKKLTLLFFVYEI